MELIKQEVSQEKWIEIPEEVRDVYKEWRSTPLVRASGLEKLLDTPAKIYYKYEIFVIFIFNNDVKYSVSIINKIPILLEVFYLWYLYTIF